MIHTKVQYDAYNRTFKLVDRDLGPLLEDYALYDLAIPFMFEDGDEKPRGRRHVASVSTSRHRPAVE